MEHMMENYEKLHSLEDNNKRMNLSPIVVFVYNRVEHTKRTIEALADNMEKLLFWKMTLLLQSIL